MILPSVFGDGSQSHPLIRMVQPQFPLLLAMPSKCSSALRLRQFLGPFCQLVDPSPPTCPWHMPLPAYLPHPGFPSPLTPAKEGWQTPSQGIEPDAQQDKPSPPLGYHPDSSQWMRDHQVAVQGDGHQSNHGGDARESPTEGIELTACGHSSLSSVLGREPSRHPKGGRVRGWQVLGSSRRAALSSSPPCLLATSGRGWWSPRTGH